MKRSRVMLFALMISFWLTMFSGTTAFAAMHANETEANALNALGIFLGKDGGYDLDAKVTRIEAAIMLSRLLGKEAEAAELNLSHPFTDVPVWASAQIGYLYQNGLVKGASETTFSVSPVNFPQMMTMVLRAMNYSDAQGDFVWSEADSKAAELGVIVQPRVDEINEVATFTRRDLVTCVYGVLTAPRKGESAPLIQTLMEEGVFTGEQVENTGNSDLMVAAGLLKREAKRITVEQTVEVTPTGNDPYLYLFVKMPDSYENRQTVISRSFSVEPQYMYEEDGAIVGVFKVDDLNGRTELTFATDMELYRYDFETAKKYSFPVTLSEEERELYTSPSEWIESDDEVFASAVLPSNDGTDLGKLNAIKSYVLSHMNPVEMREEITALVAMKKGKGDCSDYSEVFIALCRANGIPARMALGIMTDRQATGHAIAEVYLEDYGWVPFDMVNTDTGYVTFERLKPEFIYFMEGELLDSAGYYSARYFDCTIEVKESVEKRK